MSIYKRFFVFLILFSSSTISSQNDEGEIIEVILWSNINENFVMSPKYYIECCRPKTFFNINDFIETTGLDSIPDNVLNELYEASIKDYQNTWNKNRIGELKKQFSRYLLSDKCQGRLEVDKIQKRKIKNKEIEKNVYILTFHKAIFDKKKNHCVITVVTSFYQDSFFSMTYFLKKIYGKWIIISEFDEVIS